MRYNLVRDNYKNFSVFEVNRLKPRAYFIPFTDVNLLDKSGYLDERYISDQVQILSGEWDFVYYNKISSIPTIFDTDKVEFDKVAVPSTWQRTGYENPWYLNSRYQFKLNPPYFPTDMPVGVYRRNFLAGSTEKNYVLTFLGASSTLEVYINGDFVGYSEGAHNTAEFDISKHITSGLNELVVVVHKWCNGTYLECQDMFRENGIFRDVYITEREITHIEDFDIKTKHTDSGYTLDVSVEVACVSDNADIAIRLEDNQGNIIVSKEASAENFTAHFENLEVLEWSAEIPNLYTMFIELKNDNGTDEIVRTFVGFKRVEIRGEVFYLNNKPIKMLGVNHHDTDARNGWVMSIEQMLGDIQLMKDYNCNTVRMSHYPPDPVMLTMCDVLGLYVVDEMDLECHGVYSNPLRQQFGLIANNLKWAGHFMDRAKAMYYRDRNHASITMWSLGNESGGYKCHDICYDFFKKMSDIPVHYEGVIHTKRHSYDVISNMYAHTPKVEKIGKRQEAGYTGKPFFLCEYAHAMGVGPGALEDYVQLFYTYDNLMGGCIWEFADHAVYHENGKYKYTYGGDHNEPKHDGNFCCDGLFFPDRTPSTGALNMREVYRPIRAEKIDSKVLRFTNHNMFKDSSYIDICVDILSDGKVIGRESIDLIISPDSAVDYTLPFDIPSDSEVFLNIIYTDKNTDKYIACDSIAMCIKQYQMPESDVENIEVKDTDTLLTVNFKDGSFIYDKTSGEIVSYCYMHQELINPSPIMGKRGILPNIYRATIDNDKYISMAWKVLGMDKAKSEFKGMKTAVHTDKVQIDAVYNVSRFGKIARFNIAYTVYSDGHIDVTVKVVKGLKMAFYSDVVRVGVTLEMPKEFYNIEYYGLGERETFDDFNAHGKMGIFNERVRYMHERYIRPQESGNRSKVRYAKVTNIDGCGLVIVHKGEYLNFNANHYTCEHLMECSHMEDLTEQDTTNVQIDGLMRGVGSQICGQGPLKDAKPNISRPFEYSFTLIPIKE